MRVQFKKVLLAGTALVALASTSAQAATATVGQGATVTISADPSANPSIHYTGASTGTANVNDTINVSGGNITTDNSGVGTLNFLGTSTVSGDIGDSSHSISKLTVATGTVDLLGGGDVYATTISIDAGTLASSNDIHATTINFTDDGVLFLAANATGAVTTSTLNKGNITFGGSVMLTGNVGSGTALNAITVNAGNNATITGSVNAKTITVANTSSLEITNAVTGDATLNGTSTLYLNDDMTGNITAGAVGTATVTFNDNSKITGNVGGANGLAAIEVGANTAEITGTVKALDMNISTGSLTLGGNVTGDINFQDDGSASIAAGKQLTGGVTVTGNGDGTLTLNKNATVTGTIGALNHTLKELNLNTGTSGDTITFNQDVYADSITADGTGRLVFLNALTGDIGFTDNATIELSNSLAGKVTTATTGEGTLKLITAATISIDGAVGASGASLAGLTLEGTGSFILGSTVYAKDVSIVGNSSTTFKGSVTGDITFESASNGAITLEDGQSVLGDVTSITANKGTVEFAGSGTLDGDVSNLLMLSFAGGGAASNTVTGDVTSKTISVGQGTVNLQGNITGGIAFADDGIVKISAGRTITGNITADVPDTGTLTFLNGGVIIGSVGTSGADEIATLNFNGAANTSISGKTFAQNININGTGTTTFSNDVTGTVTFTGNGGVSMAAGKAISGNVTADSAGLGTLTFLGTGTVGNITERLNAITLKGDVTAGTVLAADSTTIGTNTLTATSFNLGAGQTLNIGTDGLVDVTTATVNAASKVSVTLPDDTYVANNETFTLINGSAGAGVNQISNGNLTINGGSALISFAQTNDTQDFIIKATRQALNTVTGLTTSEKNVATVLDVIQDNGGAELTQVQIDIQNAPTAAAVEAIVAKLLPTVNNATQMALASNVTAVRSIEEKRIASIRSGDESGMSAGTSAPNAFWVQGYGQSASQGTRDTVKGYRTNTVGGAVGVDFVSDDARGVIGMSFSYGQTSIEARNSNRTGTDIDSYGIGLYGSYGLDDTFFFSAQTGYAFNDIDNARHDVGGLGTTARASYSSYQVSGKATLGADFTTPGFTLVTPSLFTSYSYLSVDGYKETGAGGANLNVGTQTADALEVGSDINFSWRMRGESGDVLKPAIHAGYSYDVTGDRIDTSASFTGGGGSFIVQGQEPARSKVTAGVGFSYLSSAQWSLTTNYNADYKQKYLSHSGTVRAVAPF